MQSTPRIEGIVETILYVDDLDRSVSFYRDILGLTAQGGDPDGHLLELITPGIWPNY